MVSTQRGDSTTKHEAIVRLSSRYSWAEMKLLPPFRRGNETEIDEFNLVNSAKFSNKINENDTG